MVINRRVLQIFRTISSKTFKRLPTL